MFYTSIETIRPPQNLYPFNDRKYFQNLRIYHQIWIKSQNFIKNDSPTKTIVGTASSTRNPIISKLRQASFGADALNVIQPCHWDNVPIFEQIRTEIIKTGAVHILAVSGLHIKIPLVLNQFILRQLN